MRIIWPVVLLIIFLIYLPWFSFSQNLSAGDWPYLFEETILGAAIFPANHFLWLDPYYYLTAKLGLLLSLPWEVSEKIFWFYPFLVISVTASLKFARFILRKGFPERLAKPLAWLGVLIYTTNTYVLMIVGGGQLGVAMAYALAPVMLLSLFKTIDQKKFKVSVFQSIPIAALQLMFDPRIFVLTIVAFGIYLWILSTDRLKFFPQQWVKIIGGAVLLNSFWIIPNLTNYQTNYMSATGNGIASFLSFASFSNAIALLHPNWPENIFGKIYFMRPEFLGLSLLAGVSLWFTRNRGGHWIKCGVLLWLSGTFFAKGVNPPLGEAYQWLTRLPGFLIFRDPTKFYLLVSLAYLILIPYSLGGLLRRLPGLFINLPICLFLLFWLYLLVPAWQKELKGTFQPISVPQSYLRLKDFLRQPQNAGAVLWIPKRQRFGWVAEDSPAFTSEELFGSLEAAQLITIFDAATAAFNEHKIKWVILPADTRGELFLTDRKYDPKLRQALRSSLKRVGFLAGEEIEGVSGEIDVFRVKSDTIN